MIAQHQAWNPAAGSAAALIHELSLAMYVGAALIFLMVMALLARAVISRPAAVDARRWLVWGGLVFPGTVLAVLLGYALAVGNALASFEGKGTLRFLLDCISGNARALAADDRGNAVTDDGLAPFRIEVTAYQWWWQVRYLTGSSGETVLANEVRIPVDRPVELQLLSADVIHSFWVPALAGKVDMIPGHRNRITIRSGVPGEFLGLCAEYCGAQHALMAFRIVALEPAEFSRWLVHQGRDAAPPADDFLRRGQDTFLAAGCGECHSVRGTEARGERGPDLTHVGGRRTLAAGTLDNHIGTMTAWIVNPQDLKPGSSMPDSRGQRGEDLRALAAWLGSLQ